MPKDVELKRIPMHTESRRILLSKLTLGARDFSSAVSGFCQVFMGDPRVFSLGFAARGFGLRPTPKIPAAGEKNLWAQLFESRLALNLGLNLTRVSSSCVQKHFLG